MLAAKDRAPVSPADPTTADFAHNPIRAYSEMRQASPIFWVGSISSFMPTRFSDTARILRSRDFESYDLTIQWRELGRKLGRDYRGALELFAAMPFIYDGDYHARLRRIYASAIAPFAGGHPAFATQIETKARRVCRDGDFDLAADFASYLLFDIFCDLLRISEDERSIVRPVSNLSWLLEGSLSVRKRDEIATKLTVALAFLREHIASQLKQLDDGFIGRAYAALPEDEADPANTVAMMACIMLVMGNDALGSCVTNGVLRLKTEDKHLVPQAEWESIADDAIRYVAPVDFLSRVALRDVEVAGCPVKKGERIVLSPLCANHDPHEFGPRAGSITVKPGKNIGLAFGAGSHLCVGNRFSRTIVRLAFAALASLPRLELAGSPVHGPGKVIRTLTSMPVRLH